MHPDTKEFTHIDPSGRNMKSRVDLLCFCNSLKPYIEQCIDNISTCPDHKAVIMSILCTDKSRGKGHWKLNASVLRGSV